MSGYDDIKKMWLTHELIMRKLKNYGDIYFVDATNGSDEYDGVDPGRPLLTLEEAIDRVTNSHNDVIIHKGYEDVAAGITVDKEKTSIFGWGLFGANPTFPEIGSFARSVAEDAPALTIDADFVEIAGLAFAAEWVVDGVAGQAALATANGANKPYIHHCFFPDWNYASQTVGLELHGCHYAVVEDCEFQSVYANMDAGIFVHSGPTQPAYTKIKRCDFYGGLLAVGAMAAGILEYNATWQHFGIKDCNFINVTNALVLEAAASRWGYIRNCVGSMTKGTFMAGGSACDTIANAVTNYKVTMADVWGSDGPLTV